MTRIRATCPACGEVDLGPEQIELDIVPALTHEVGSESTYQFRCPECDADVVKPADERIVALLRRGGVVDRPEPAAAPSRHPEDPRPGPALTEDDLAVLMALLRTDDWFAGLEAMTR